MDEVRLTKGVLRVAFSPDGALVAVSGFDGAVKVYDTASLQRVYRGRVKGPVGQLPIHHHAISASNRFYAFSCLRKVFVVDLGTGETVAEIPVSTAERRFTVPVRFARRRDALIVPDGSQLLYHDLEDNRSRTIPVHPDAGEAFSIAVDAEDRFIAYTGVAGAIVDKAFIVDTASQTVSTIDLPYEYVPGRQMFQAAVSFVDDSDLVAIARKSVGISFFRRSGEHVRTVGFEQLGGRAMFGWDRVRISPDGRYLGMNVETSDNAELSEWRVWVPGGFTQTIIDLHTGQTVFTEKIGEHDADFHVATGRVALLAYEDAPNFKTVNYLRLRSLPIG